MGNKKSTEFITVLLAALLAGAAVSVMLKYLQGTALYTGSVVLIAVAILVLRFLRKRFGRGY